MRFTSSFVAVCYKGGFFRLYLRQPHPCHGAAVCLFWFPKGNMGQHFCCPMLCLRRDYIDYLIRLSCLLLRGQSLDALNDQIDGQDDQKNTEDSTDVEPHNTFAAGHNTDRLRFLALGPIASPMTSPMGWPLCRMEANSAPKSWTPPKKIPPISTYSITGTQPKTAA